MSTQRQQAAVPVRWPVVAAAALFALPVAVSVTEASRPETPVLDGAEVVADRELATMRGRFTEGNRVIRFGIRMVSQMRSAAGQRLEAHADLNVDLSGGRPAVAFRPHVSIERPTRDRVPGDHDDSGGTGSNVAHGGSGADESTTVDVGDGGETSGGDDSGGRGVVQQVQVAGDGNAAVNDVRIDVVEQAAARKGPPAQGTPADGADRTRAIARGPDGTRVSVKATRKGLALELDMPGRGSVSQQVQAGSGLRQLIDLRSDGNSAASAARLRVELRDALAGSGDAGSMRRALDRLDTLR